MLFHSIQYGLFLSLVWLTAWGFLKKRLALRHAFLLVASYFFYMNWNAAYALLIGFSTLLDYVIGQLLYQEKSSRRRKWLLVASLVGNLGLLGTFKYFNFFMESVSAMLSFVGLPGLEMTLRVLLPVGVSFYTFQSMSYTLDIYQGKIKPARNLLEFMLFVAFFPQLVAGPIVRARQFLPQLEHVPTYREEAMISGLYRIFKGLVKKVVIADTLGRLLVDPVFSHSTQATGMAALCAMYAVALQVYYDFSAYTDIAIGSGRLLGFWLPENFNAPYRATNIEAIWRRWHMTLTTWVRDYFYVPLTLGTRRSSAFVPYRNLIIAMLLVGLWHGAAWTFVLFGLYHGIGLCVTRFYRRRWRSRPHEKPKHSLLGIWVTRILTFHYACFSFILFRAPDLSTAWRIFLKIFDISSWHMKATIPRLGIILLLVAFAAHMLPEGMRPSIENKFVKLPAPVQGLAAVCALALVNMFMKGARPFVYFQF